MEAWRRTFPAIVIDTREPVETAYTFSGLATVREKLEQGDYSLKGYEAEVACERKEKSDGWACVGSGRERFTDCLRRLSGLSRPAIVVEASLDEFAKAPGYVERLLPSQVIGSYISWSCQYRIPVFWCPNRDYAERVTLRFLQAYWKHMVKHD
jgi:ERCC4-type nuclease